MLQTAECIKNCWTQECWEAMPDCLKSLNLALVCYTAFDNCYLQYYWTLFLGDRADYTDMGNSVTGFRRQYLDFGIGAHC